MNLDRKSRLLIKALRHTPEELKLKLDKKGFTDVSKVLQSLELTKDELDVIVDTNNKKRFEYNEDQSKIRASQGHSLSGLEIHRDWKEYVPTGVLYHGSSVSSMMKIWQDGLKPMTRTHVHLSKDKQVAFTVGARHGTPLIFSVHADQMYRDGYRFYESANGVILVDSVPPKYLS